MRPIPKTFEDPRRPIEKVRRSDLWLILRHFGINVAPDTSVDTMRRFADERGIDVMRVNFAEIKARRKAELKSFWPETPVAPIPKPIEPVRVKKANEFFELRKACKDLGIPFEKTDKKPDLIRRLEESRGKDTPPGG